MAHETQAPSPSVSLDQRISDLERRVAERRRSSSVHSAAIAQRVRDALGSPIALLVAAGIGFAVSRFGLSRKSGPPEREDAAGAGGHSLLSTVMEAVGLAGTLMAMLPKNDAPAREPPPDPLTPPAGSPR